MDRKKKRKVNRVILISSSDTNQEIRYMKLHKTLYVILTFVMCIVLGAGVGYFAFESEILEKFVKKNVSLSDIISEQRDTIEDLESVNEELRLRITALENEIQVLSDTVLQKAENEQELNDQIAEQSVPTLFPISTSSIMNEKSETVKDETGAEDYEAPVCVFISQVNTLVMATAAGKVVEISDDSTYGTRILVDHGNSYSTVYRCDGVATVNSGQTVNSGDTLFLVTEADEPIAYQLMYDGIYIDPTDLLDISG